MANSAGAPKVASLRTIKSDVVVGLGDDGDEVAEKLDESEKGWKISGKYVSVFADGFDDVGSMENCRLLFFCLTEGQVKRFDSLREAILVSMFAVQPVLQILVLVSATTYCSSPLELCFDNSIFSVPFR